MQLLSGLLTFLVSLDTDFMLGTNIPLVINKYEFHKGFTPLLTFERRSSPFPLRLHGPSGVNGRVMTLALFCL